MDLKSKRNKSINLLRDACLKQNFDIFKTPHRTSCSSKRMIQYLSNNLFYTCSTVYKKGNSNLPNDDIVAEYLEHTTEFHCTGTKTENNQEDYGVIENVFNLYKKEAECKLHGNAVKISSE